MATARVDFSSDVIVIPDVSRAPAREPGEPEAAAAAVPIPMTATHTTNVVVEYLWALIAVAAIVAAVFVADGVAPDENFPPPEQPALVDGLVLFAVFYVAAQAIERLLEPFSNLLMTSEKKTADAEEGVKEAKIAIGNAQEAEAGGGVPETVAANVETTLDNAAMAMAVAAARDRHRAILFWVLATVVGIAVSAGMKLYLLQRAGIPNTSRWWEILATGLIIGAGTKPLHDLIEFISAKKESAAEEAARA